jgi:hypothetical protein
LYGGIGLNYGKSIETFSASLTRGYIGSPFDDEIPDAHIEGFLTGWAINGGGGVFGGGGVTYSPGADRAWISKTAWEGGIYLPPAAGISAVYSWKLDNIFIPGDQ